MKSSIGLVFLIVAASQNAKGFTINPNILRAYKRGVFEARTPQRLEKIEVITSSEIPSLAVALTFRKESFVAVQPELRKISKIFYDFVVRHEKGHIILRHSHRRDKLIDATVEKSKGRPFLTLNTHFFESEISEANKLMELEADAFATGAFMALNSDPKNVTKIAFILRKLASERPVQSEFYPDSALRVNQILYFQERGSRNQCSDRL